MKKILWFLIFLLFNTSLASFTFAGDFNQKIKEEAEKYGIEKVEETIVSIKSISKNGNEIKLIFNDYYRIGSIDSMEVIQLVLLKWTPNLKPDEIYELYALPEDTKKAKVYWGYAFDGRKKVIALEKIQ